MINLSRAQQKDLGSPRDAGEIDTKAPFLSVKAAVSLFGDVAVARERSAIKKTSTENALGKETQLLLVQRELNKIKQHLNSAETVKDRALSELEKAKLTLKYLTTKLTTVKKSKQSAIEEAEAMKNQAKLLEKAKSEKAVGFEARKRELEHVRKEYRATVIELNAAKKELFKIRQDFDAALEAKLDAFHTAGEAQYSTKLKSKRISELAEEIAAMKASTEELKLASIQAQEEQAKVMNEIEAQLNSYKTAKEVAQKKLIFLKKEYDPELIRSLEDKLVDTIAEIDLLQEEIKKSHAPDMDIVRVETSELIEATKTLREVAEEESSLRNLVASLRTELEQVKKEQDKLKEKEQTMETLAKEKEDDFFDEQSLKIQQLSLETENARREADEMSRKAQELKKEAENARAVTDEVEKKLELVKKEAEEAKAAEQRAVEEMNILSHTYNRNPDSNSESGGKIRLSVEMFESLSGEVRECEDLAEKTEEACMAQVEEIIARKNETERKVEARKKAIEEIMFAIDLALRNAEMADSAKIAVEGELRRLRQQEQKVAAAEASSQDVAIIR